MKQKLTIVDYTTIALFLMLSLYFLHTSLTPASWMFLDGVNLIFHEAGHLIFFPFGEYISIAGGTIMQLLIPAVVCIYFFFHQQYFSAYTVLFWLGQSCINVSVYASDAITQQLPLLGGGSVIHDWQYLLSHTGLLDATPIVAGFFFWSGILLYILAPFLAIRRTVLHSQNIKY